MEAYGILPRMAGRERLRTIEMPEGLVAGSIGLDEPADVVWVSTCVPAEAQFPDSIDPCRLAPGS